jgi:hypothetical protein
MEYTSWSPPWRWRQCVPLIGGFLQEQHGVTSQKTLLLLLLLLLLIWQIAEIYYGPKKLQYSIKQKFLSQHIYRNQYQMIYGLRIVWVSILDNKFFGPVVLHNMLTGAVYRSYFVDDWPVVLEPDSLDQLQHVWFIHVGGPTHFSSLWYSVRTPERLSQTFSAKWTGRGGTMNWPPASPDLTTLDFWLC